MQQGFRGGGAGEGLRGKCRQGDAYGRRGGGGRWKEGHDDGEEGGERGGMTSQRLQCLHETHVPEAIPQA